MGILYKTTDNNWEPLVLPSSMLDPDVTRQVEILTEKVAEIEALLQGLAEFTGVEV